MKSPYFHTYPSKSANLLKVAPTLRRCLAFWRALETALGPAWKRLKGTSTGLSRSRRYIMCSAGLPKASRRFALRSPRIRQLRDARCSTREVAAAPNPSAENLGSAQRIAFPFVSFS